MAGGLFVAVVGDLGSRGGLFGPLFVVLLAGGLVIAGLDFLEAGARLWAFLDRRPEMAGDRIVVGAFRLVELAVAVLLAFLAAGTGYLGSLSASPEGGGVLLFGLVGIQAVGLLLAVLVVLRFVIAAAVD